MIRWFAFLVVLAFSGFGSAAEEAEARMPFFSWDTVPRYMHVRKVTAFSPAEIEYLATFPLLTFEKTTGQKEFGSTEKGTIVAARAVKSINPTTKILYYRNIFVHYSKYDSNDELKKIEDPFLRSGSGSTKLIRNQVPAYDLSNEKLQNWWLQSAGEVCSAPEIDGLFVDGNIKALEKGYLRAVVGAEKKDKVMEGYHEVMRRLPTALGSDELIVSNIIRARLDRSGLEHLSYFDGSYIEGFEHNVGRESRVDYLAKGIAAIQEAARSGKIIAFTMSTKAYSDTDMDEEGSKSRKRLVVFQERLTYTLALFLICAEKHSYFLLHDGYGVDGGESELWMKAVPEYERPLGPPRGKAIKQGTVYQRSFQYADVTVDIEKESATISWKSPS